MSEKTKKNVQTAEQPKLEADKTVAIAAPTQITEQAMIDEVLVAFEIPPEKAAFAKKMGINVDKIALYVGSLELRLRNLEKTQGVSYAPVQPPQQTQPIPPPPPPRGGGLGISLADILGLVKSVQAPSTNLSQLAEMLKEARAIADVINPPSRFDTLAQRAMARQWNKLGLLDTKEIESLGKEAPTT